MKTSLRGIFAVFFPAAAGIFFAYTLTSCYTEKDFASFSADSKNLRGVCLEKYKKWENEFFTKNSTDGKKLLSSATEINSFAFTETLPQRMTSGVLHLSLDRTGINHGSLCDCLISGVAVYREMPSGKITSSALPPVRLRLEPGKEHLQFASAETNIPFPGYEKTGNGEFFPMAGIRAIFLADHGKTLVVYTDFRLYRNDLPRKLSPPENTCIFRKNTFLRFQWNPDTGKNSLPEPAKSRLIRTAFRLP